MNFIRNCPKCNKVLSYTNERGFLSAVKFNSLCHSCPLKGRIVSDETKLKMKLNAYDKSGAKNPNYGKVSVLRGRKIEEIRSPENVKALRARLSKGLYSGYKHSDETKRKIGIAISGEKNGFFNRKHTDETKNIIRNKTIKQYQDGRTSKINSKPELIFETYLKQLKINYRKQEPFAYWLFDFYLTDYNIYIECDGDYWHANPLFYKNEFTIAQKKNIKNDKCKTSFMKNKNKCLIHFWEYDIKNKPECVLGKLESLIHEGQQSDKIFI